MNVALHTIECFAGVGMLGVGLHAGLGHLGIETRTVCYVEREAFAASVMAARMAEGALDDAPVCTDVTSFDAAAWRGSVDCVIGGFPCQDLSLAGRRAGLDGKRSGLFFELLRIAEDSGARYLFLENVAGIASATATVVDEAEGELEERAASRVLGELADRGWDAEWLTLSASDVGASHGRERWFCWAWRKVDDSTSSRRDGARERAEANIGSRECVPCAGREDVADTGLQHRDLQQRAHGAEHPGGGGDVDDAECSERRPARSARAGGQQGHDGRRAEAHGGLGEPIEILECDELAHTTGRGRHERRPESGREQGRPDAAERGGAVADTENIGYTIRPHIEQQRPAGEQGPDDDIRREPVGLCATVADASSQRQQRPELGTTRNGNRGGQEAHGPAEQLRRPLFAPGPADAAWTDILTRWPWLAPAIDKTAESVLHRMADGLARGLDFHHRAARLKCCGNGVVPLQAAAAAVVLVRRMMETA